VPEKDCPYKILLAAALYELAKLADQHEDVRAIAFRARVKLIHMAVELGVQLPAPTP
jgi:hypothetical protein